jgi:hypothetical protein
LIGEVGPRVKTTFYTKYGNVLPTASIIILAVSFLASLVVLVIRPGHPEGES